MLEVEFPYSTWAGLGPIWLGQYITGMGNSHLQLGPLWLDPMDEIKFVHMFTNMILCTWYSFHSHIQFEPLCPVEFLICELCRAESQSNRGWELCTLLGCHWNIASLTLSYFAGSYKIFQDCIMIIFLKYCYAHFGCTFCVCVCVLTCPLVMLVTFLLGFSLVVFLLILRKGHMVHSFHWDCINSWFLMYPKL